MGLPPIPQQEEDMAQEDGRVHSLHSAEPPNSLSPDCNEKHAFVTGFFLGRGGPGAGLGEGVGENHFEQHLT